MEFTNGREEDITNVDTNNVSHQELEEKKGFDISDLFINKNECHFTYMDLEFSIQDMTTYEESKYSHLYMFEVVNEKTGKKTKEINSTLAQIVKLTKLIKVPFTKKYIEKELGINKDWTELTIPQRFDLLTKNLKGEHIVGIFRASQEALNTKEEEKEVGNL